MKTNLDVFYKADESLEKSGVWFKLNEKTAFLVKPVNLQNHQYRRAHAIHFKPFKRQIEAGTLDPKKEQEILAKLFVEACLVDWKGVVIDGADTKFSKDIALEFFAHLPELFQTLVDYASDHKNYLEQVDEEVGNS